MTLFYWEQRWASSNGWCPVTSDTHPAPDKTGRTFSGARIRNLAAVPAALADLPFDEIVAAAARGELEDAA